MRLLSSRIGAWSRRGLTWAALWGFVAVLAAAAEPAKPTKKDSIKGIRPTEATLTASVEPAEAKPGSKVTYRVSVKLRPGWHIYKFSKTEKDDDGEGPRNTTFDFFDTDGLKLVGNWTASKSPIRKPEPAFNNKVLEFFEDEVAWTLPLQVPADAAPGKVTLRCQAGYQICNDVTCKFPGQWTLPDVVLTILPGGSGGGTAAAPKQNTNELQPTTLQVPTAEPAAADGKAAAPAVVSEIEREAQLGLIPFLLFSAFGGLLALAMPCVWPMVPITVNFFVKQGQNKTGGTTRLAIVYCLAIIGIFTAVGVLFSFFFTATALQNLANNPWLNVAIAVLFLAFGLSLLGVFEIRLPNFLLNASAQQESRGGLIGVIFMALTLTITSFTCTFPVVGGLVVMAAGGKFFYPIVGLATFATVLALPFFFLALSPGLLTKLPKSGDWMNSVKVVGALLEIGAALKFINTAEIGFGAVPEDAWFDAQVVLAAWVVLAAVCGIYLLGLFRTDHDLEEVKVGPGRILLGSVFLGLALYLAPALFGRPPQSPIWYTIVGILPPDVNELTETPAAPGSAGGKVDAVSSDPTQAEREQKSFHGVVWGLSYEAAQEQARAEGKPILIDFTGVNCANCRTMELAVMPRPEVVKLLEKFVTVQLYTDYVPIRSITREQKEQLAEKNQERILAMVHDASNPFYVVVSPEGQVVARLAGLVRPSVFTAFLKDGLAKAQNGQKLAQAGTVR
jgi:thiol:disulfide interchange protein DsbD